MTEHNDPRVFFAAERTALAWNRSALTLMAFGFGIERFGIFMRMLVKEGTAAHHGASFWFGLVFITLGCAFSLIAAFQYRSFLHTLATDQIPPGTNTRLPFILNIIIALLAGSMLLYLLSTDL